MSDKFETINPQNIELQGYIEKIPWRKFLDYGSVKISVQNGKAVLISIEKTVRILNRV
ncbi:MAG: hypothetical protein MUP81_06255 [Dehalococcoidia bacterium]|nr:hypothetical protein [Dehalococcoidia bacterium]